MLRLALLLGSCILGLFCCPGCLCLLGDVVVPVIAEDRHTCSASPSTNGFKAAAPANQRWIVSPTDWYQDLRLAVPQIASHECFFLFPRSPRPPPREAYKFWFLDTPQWSPPAKIWTFEPYLCFSSTDALSVCPFIRPIKSLFFDFSTAVSYLHLDPRLSKMCATLAFL